MWSHNDSGERDTALKITGVVVGGFVSQAGRWYDYTVVGMFGRGENRVTRGTGSHVAPADSEATPDSQSNGVGTVRRVTGGALETGACCLEGCGCLASLGFAVLLLVAGVAFAATQLVQSVYASIP